MFSAFGCLLRGRRLGQLGIALGRKLPPAETTKPKRLKTAATGRQESAFRCLGLTFLAMTRSEARARIKRHFGWSRVPVGLVIERV